MNDKAFWDDLIENDVARPILPGEMTADQYAQKIGKSVPQAYRILRVYVRKGILTRRAAYSNGRRCWAYSPAKKESKKAVI